MKNKIVLILLSLFVVSGLSAQHTRSQKRKKMSVREDRQNAVVAEMGYKSLSGLGVNYTRYVNEHIAIDAGAGLGLQLFRLGVQSRYLFLTKNFSPYAGAGLVLLPLGVDDVQVDGTTGSFIVDIKSNVQARIIAGLEFMSDGGFVISGDLGYQIPISSPYDTTGANPDDELLIRILYGRGLSFSGKIGYAF